MTHSIQISKVIYERLMTLSPSLGVGTKVFPIVAELDTTMPFCVYVREGITPSSGTKDGYIGDQVTFRIDVVSSSYNVTTDIADSVRGLFEQRIINSTTAMLQLRDCYMSGFTEAWDSESYIIQMRFTCTVCDLCIQ